ncbi:MAG: hypothetical protein KC431_00380 [Myxococcales bacterium]|nr:hypothetical protein [Myxococcales bacterium]
MEYVRSLFARSSVAPLGTRRRKLRTGPLPGVPWRQLERPHNLEDHLPLLILVGFGLLATIQALLVF